MKILYLIRHGQPAFPAGKKLCIGSTELPLSQTGLAQARALALPAITALYVSPQRRCIQTAEAFGLPYRILPGLRELHMGAWEGLDFDTIRAEFPDLYAARGQDLTLLPPGAEDLEQALSRFEAALRFASEASAGHCALITHSGITAQYLYRRTGLWHKMRYLETAALDAENFLPIPCEDLPAMV